MKKKFEKLRKCHQFDQKYYFLTSFLFLMSVKEKQINIQHLGSMEAQFFRSFFRNIFKSRIDRSGNMEKCRFDENCLKISTHNSMQSLVALQICELLLQLFLNENEKIRIVEKVQERKKFLIRESIDSPLSCRIIVSCICL